MSKRASRQKSGKKMTPVEVKRIMHQQHTTSIIVWSVFGVIILIGIILLIVFLAVLPPGSSSPATAITVF